MSPSKDSGVLTPESPKTHGPGKSNRRTRSKHKGPVSKLSPLKKKKKLSPGSHKPRDRAGPRKPNRSSSEKMHNAASLTSHKIPHRSPRTPRTPVSPPVSSAPSPKSPVPLQMTSASRSRPGRCSSSQSQPRGRNTVVNRSLIAVCLGLAVTLGTAFLLHRVMKGKFLREGEPRNAPTKCTSDSCVRYNSLLSAAIEDAMPPCRDFYTHVCGLWSRTQELGETAIQVMWDDFMKFVMSTLDHLQISSVNQVVTQKGLLYLKSCLSVLKVDNVENVKRVLARGGILWPEQNPKPDFLNAILFMSFNVFAPVLLELDIKDNYGRGTYLHWQLSNTYNYHSGELRRLFGTRHMRVHLAVSYKEFAGTYNETRLEQLLTNLNSLEEFLKRWKDVEEDLRMSNDSADILRYTPSVDRSRWDMVLQRYTNNTLAFYKGLSIQNVKYFADIFAMHKNLGEDTMNDIIETLSVQNLLEFTNSHIQVSYYQSKDKAVALLSEFCLYSVYALFGYALNNQFLQMGLYKELKKVTKLAESMRQDYPKLVTEFSSDPSDKNRSSRIAFSVRADVFKEAFDILSRSTPSGYPALYKGYPAMTEKPLENWIHMSNYFTGFAGNESSVLLGYGGQFFKRFKNFTMMLYHLRLPFYAEDAHLGTILGGVGTSLAATLFYDHVDRVAKHPAEVYERNQRCLSSKPERPNLDLQGAVAAVPIVSALYRKWSRDANLSAFTGDIPPFLSSQLPYFAACYLLCGKDEGPLFCNTPHRHSSDFARAFGCEPDSPMNPKNKCSMFP